MAEASKPLPPAQKSLEEFAQRLMDSGLSPEEYAGRHGARVMMCSIHRYQYERAETTAWVHRLGEILSVPALLKHYQKTYLTPEEWEALQNEGDPF